MWTETECTQSADLPTMCRQSNPEETASTILPGSYRAEADATTGSLPVFFLLGASGPTVTDCQRRHPLLKSRGLAVSCSTAM
jgi:hypothetical protein